MTRFADTQAGADFIASAASRETSPEIMRAIAFFARTLDEAVLVWEEGAELTGVCTDLDIWEHVTGNGLRPATDYCWGASGSRWWSGCEGCGFRTDRLIAQSDGRMLCAKCDSHEDDVAEEVFLATERAGCSRCGIWTSRDRLTRRGPQLLCARCE
jgi:hypothetical protein